MSVGKQDGAAVEAAVRLPWYAEFQLSKAAHARMLSDWHAKGWPLQLLLRDHFSAKVLEDNGIFTLMERFGHKYHWTDEEGLVVRCKRSYGTALPGAVAAAGDSDGPSADQGSDGGETLDLRASLSDKPAVETYVSWSELVPTVAQFIKVVRPGDTSSDNLAGGDAPAEDKFILNSGAVGYGPEWGFELLPESRVYQFPRAEHNFHMGLWVERGWPVQFLLRDHYGAKVLYDNQVFPLMEFYGHEWTWSEEEGLKIPVRLEGEAKAKMRPWSAVVEIIQIQKTAQGWLLFDGWNYLQDGLVPVHLWQWRELTPSYTYPADARPGYCYLDIVSFSWEHEGMQGFGLQTPHGHTAIEFGDDEGNMYSVGAYMDPRSQIDTKSKVAATLRAAFMCPDPYMPSKGEKTVHRIDIGSGSTGRANFARLKEHFEELQGWRRDPKTGLVSTCSTFKYNTFNKNCGNFVQDAEEFALKQLHGQLVKIGEDTPLPPGRTMLPKSVHGVWWRDMAEAMWNTTLLLAVDILILFVISTPWLSNKIGVGLDDTEEDEIEALAEEFERDSGPPPEPATGNAASESDSTSLRRRRSGGAGDASEVSDAIGDPVVNDGDAEPNRISRATKVVKAAVGQYAPNRVVFPRKVRGEQLYSSRLKNYSVRLISR
jgi:hypothetical protein